MKDSLLCFYIIRSVIIPALNITGVAMKTETLIAISASLLLSVTMLPLVSAHDGYYLSDTSGNPIRDSSGNCILSISGHMLEGCGPTAPPPVFHVMPASEAVKEVVPEPVVMAAPKPVAVPKPAAPVVPKIHRLQLNETGGSNFATNSAKLSSKARNQLMTFANKIKASSISVFNVIIIGHTDNTGSAAYNQILSLKRAQSVADYLVSQGISRSVMLIGGKGESQPVASNKTKAGRAANRRVVISVTGQSL